MGWPSVAPCTLSLSPCNSAISGQDDSGPKDAHTFSKELHLVPELNTPCAVPVGNIAINEQHDWGQQYS